jgi:hypothetical protein
MPGNLYPMKQTFMVMAAGGFLCLLACGGMAVKNPKVWVKWTILAMLTFTAGTIGLGVQEQQGVDQKGGWNSGPS